MCKSRRDALAFHPRRPSSTNPTPSSPSFAAAASAIIFLSTTNTSTAANSSSSTSSQTISSLASLRSSIPATPSLYSPSDISSAILHPRTQPLSPSSFRCSLRNRDVFLHRRQFRADPSLLPTRLADLCKSHHRSLIRLLGASLSSDTVHLVYDFAPGAPSPPASAIPTTLPSPLSPPGSPACRSPPTSRRASITSTKMPPEAAAATSIISSAAPQ